VGNVESWRSSKAPVNYQITLNHISEDGAVKIYITSMKGINQSIFIMERKNVSCETGTEPLDVTKTNLMSERVHSNIICRQ
jgi:hypothetical protein